MKKLLTILFLLFPFTLWGQEGLEAFECNGEYEVHEVRTDTTVFFHISNSKGQKRVIKATFNSSEVYHCTLRWINHEFIFVSYSGGVSDWYGRVFDLKRGWLVYECESQYLVNSATNIAVYPSFGTIDQDDDLDVYVERIDQRQGELPLRVSFHRLCRQHIAPLFGVSDAVIEKKQTHYSL